ncbi:amidase [Vineibacter terrae]|uniref:amidase n=1 Tax=Vineibacter terrae TaxID=2586908 RepID=UPI001E2E4980|nr:amidase [Vineibacter terrae]
MTSDLTRATAAELAALYRKGKASPVEALKAILARAETVNPRLNALCLIDAEPALKAATASEKRWKKGETLSAIDGVPVSIKELVRVKGWPTLMGSKAVDPHQPWTEDAPAVQRLREAGAVIFAQSTSPEYGHKGVTESPLRGVTRNPWDLERTSGGSSGGAGAAVVAGLGPLAIGTDGGGSIRLPASFCGIVGHKPTFGRVAAWPPSVNGDLANTGPMTRTVEDCALMMNVIARPDMRDPTSLPADDVDYVKKLDGKVKKLKVGLVLKFGDHHLDPEVGALVAKAARTFEKLGCEVEEATPDLGGVDGRKIFGIHWLCFVQRVLQMFPPEKHALLDPTLLAMARDGAKYSSADLVAAMADRRTLSLGWNRFLAAYDLLLCPTLAVPAFDVGRMAPALADGTPNTQWSPYTHHFNLSRHPSASVPCGLTKSGLPVGLMITAGHYRDALVLRAAHHYQAAAPLKTPALPA